MATNQQPVELQDTSIIHQLDVVDIWDTIQGEGPYAGTPAAFVRLAGCTLKCPKCDTDYTTGRRMMDVEEIHDKVMAFKRKIVVLTGGEPFRQNLSHLLSLLRASAIIPQVETNGTCLPLYQPWQAPVIVMSPKTTEIHRGFKSALFHLKYIIQDGKVDPTDGLPTSSLGMKQRPFRPWKDESRRITDWNVGTIYVQPYDSGDAAENKYHIAAAVESCMKYGYTLCLQTHKIANLK